jgi:hypothetical protein
MAKRAMRAENPLVFFAPPGSHRRMFKESPAMPSLARIVFALMLLSFPLGAQTIDFGDDSSEWAQDGECDDRRFAGPGTSMSSGFNREDIGTDATDCRTMFAQGKVYLWLEPEARAATQCSAIDFGTNTGEWINDNQCDDPRFEGPGTADDLLFDDIGKDSADCRRLCRAGRVFLRDYKAGITGL